MKNFLLPAPRTPQKVKSIENYRWKESWSLGLPDVFYVKTETVEVQWWEADLRKSNLPEVPQRGGCAHVWLLSSMFLPPAWGLVGRSQLKTSHPLVVSPGLPLESMFLVPVLNRGWALHTVCALSPDLFLGEGEQKPKDRVLAAQQRCLASIKIKGEHKSKIRLAPSPSGSLR